jgi:hypothetical protein
MKGRLADRLVLLLLAVAVQTCGDGSPTAPSRGVSPRSADFVRVELMAPGTLPPGATAQLQLMGTRPDGTTVELTAQARWQSSRADIISVDSSGRAMAHSAGESSITATSGTRTSTREVIVVPQGTYRLSILVIEAGTTTPGSDVRLEVIDGIGRGLVAAAPVSGRHSLYGVAGHATIRISGSKYLERLERVLVDDHALISVEMSPAEPQRDVSGDYTLTIAADPACRAVLPGELAVRSYTAHVTQAGPEVRVALGGAKFDVRQGRGDRMVGTMADSGSRILFTLGGFGGDYYDADFNPDVLEHVFPVGYYLPTGVVVVDVSRSVMSGRFDGTLQLVDVGFYGYWAPKAECRSPVHSFVLAR